MHTKSLATLKYQVPLVLELYLFLSGLGIELVVVPLPQLLRNRLVASARRSIRQNASLGQLYGNMQEVYNQMQTPLVYQQPQVKNLLKCYIELI